MKTIGSVWVEGRDISGCLLHYTSTNIVLQVDASYRLAHYAGVLVTMSVPVAQQESERGVPAGHREPAAQAVQVATIDAEGWIYVRVHRTKYFNGIIPTRPPNRQPHVYFTRIYSLSFIHVPLLNSFHVRRSTIQASSARKAHMNTAAMPIKPTAIVTSTCAKMSNRLPSVIKTPSGLLTPHAPPLLAQAQAQWDTGLRYHHSNPIQVAQSQQPQPCATVRETAEDWIRAAYLLMALVLESSLRPPRPTSAPLLCLSCLMKC